MDFVVYWPISQQKMHIIKIYLLLSDYEEDFFISSSARPFESLGIMPTSSQFFPGIGMYGLKAQAAPPPLLTPSPSLDFTTPDSGVEDITPGSVTADDEYKTKIPTDLTTACWKSLDSGSSSESVSPSSPASEVLGGLRHTRDKLKLDLPPSPHLASPRHNRVFNFSLEKPKPKRTVSVEEKATPLVMSDETPIVTTSLPLDVTDDVTVPEPTFSTFGKCIPKSVETEKGIVFDEMQESVGTGQVDIESKEVDNKNVNSVMETMKGENVSVDSGDEDSGIESSSKATLERNDPITKIT